MLIKFYEDSLCTTLIKNLVTTTPLPIYDVVINGDYVVKKCMYIYKARVIYIIKSGIISVPYDTLEIGLSYVSLVEDGASFIVQSIFDFRKYYIDSTRKFTAPNSFYDSETHKLLYKYLSCVKAFYEIDLFHLYNIYAGEVVDTFHLATDLPLAQGELPLKLSTNSDYKVIAVPIKFNHQYTIWMSSNSSIILGSVLMNKSGLILIKKNNKKEAISNFSILKNLTKVNRLTFNDPYLFTGINLTSDMENDNWLYNFQNSLYLIILTSARNTSSIVVMEGDHRVSHHEIIPQNNTLPKIVGTNNSKEVRLVVNADNSRNKIDKFLKKLSISEKCSLYRPRKLLTAMNSNTVFAFNDKLIEYIVHNAICGREWIENNISTILLFIPSDLFEDDIWQDSMQLDIYNKQLSNINKDKYYINEYTDASGTTSTNAVYCVELNEVPFDCNGLIDRQAEYFLFKNKDRITR